GALLARWGLSLTTRTGLPAEPPADPGWPAIATLDAATRMLTAIVRSGGLRYGQEAGRVLQRLVEDHGSLNAARLIPSGYWSVRSDPSQPDRIRFSGAVLVRVKGRTTSASARDRLTAGKILELSPDLVTAVEERPHRPVWEVM